MPAQGILLQTRSVLPCDLAAEGVEPQMQHNGNPDTYQGQAEKPLRTSIHAMSAWMAMVHPRTEIRQDGRATDDGQLYNGQ